MTHSTSRTLSVTAVLMLAAAWLLSGCIGPMTIHARGPDVEQRYALGELERASFSGRGDVRLVPSNESVLVVSAPQNILDVLDIEVRQGRLNAGPRHGVRLSHTTPAPVYTLYVNELERLDFSGSMVVHADQLNTHSLRLSGSGAVKGDLRVNVSELSIHGSGSVDLTLTGQTDTLDVHGSGAVRLDATDLLARSVELYSSGSAHVSVWAEESLKVHSSGSTRVRYRGQPLVSQSISGSSSVEALDD
ncbi:head GIN domain-containing protein [Saccharospirillum mangrovi]|uniref:head GIN domain-containing protein n=1 Tax=Saccharospirillum mangrovi TaxID=2161747 RepID=UPI0013004C99|nr:head GIN domain-containing protein [Saccharospirillum mangrovi]